MRSRLLASLALGTLAVISAAQTPTKPGEWTTYNGDNTGQRFSKLDQINAKNVDQLRLRWSFQLRAAGFKGTPLMIGGVLYFTTPDNVWAADAHDGREIWHWHRQSDGNHIGNRGVAYHNGRLYFGTPDAHIICLNAKDGKQIWDSTIEDVQFGYYISVAPLVVKDQIVIGTSGDQTDVPHSIQALNPETGKQLWRWDSLPKPGSDEAKTWPNADALAHGGGPAWVTGTYDPELNLIYWGTGNPHPVLGGTERAGANLFTCSIVALNADTGKLVWYFQPSPHDTHDWDAVETPVLFDAPFKGKQRKLLAQASRNGYFFVLDRASGENLLTSTFVPVDWAQSLNKRGEPISDPKKEPTLNGALVHAFSEGATNWEAPSYDPQTKLFYVNAMDGFTIFYLQLGANGKPEGHQGGLDTPLWSQPRLVAVDYETGKIVWWRDEEPGFSHPGILTTAGGLLFTGDVSSNVFALDPKDGKTLWHTRVGGNLNSSPMTYMLDGEQYVLTGADSVLYAWTLPKAR